MIFLVGLHLVTLNCILTAIIITELDGQSYKRYFAVFFFENSSIIRRKFAERCVTPQYIGGVVAECGRSSSKMLATIIGSRS